MSNFPEIMIIRYYELDWIEVTYSDNWSKENMNLISDRLQKELEEDKYLETYQIFHNGEDIRKEEEEREKWEI